MGIPRLTDPPVVRVSAETGLNLRLARLLHLVSLTIDPKMKFAVGGAVAVAEAGWQRHTNDLDIFARPVSTRRLVKRLAALGVKTFWITDAHAVAFLEEDNREAIAEGEAPAIRVDIVSTVTEPEASAIRTAIDARTLGPGIKVFRPDYLAAIKFLAGRPQDLIDFDELIRLGTDIERVRYIVAASDESKMAAVTARAQRAKQPQRGVRERKGIYLSLDEFEAAFKAAIAREG